MATAELQTIAKNSKHLAGKGWPWQGNVDGSGQMPAAYDDVHVDFPWRGLNGHSPMKNIWSKPTSMPALSAEEYSQKLAQHRANTISSEVYKCLIDDCAVGSLSFSCANHLATHIDVHHEDKQSKAIRQAKWVAARERRDFVCTHEGCIHPPFPTGPHLHQHIQNQQLGIHPFLVIGRAAVVPSLRRTLAKDISELYI
ncbi:hypothetical protein C1H76_2201 [Elsinoe australis]|uniref:Uncharacterized protein n=1 Tax=Elsinoe australis TaxID=40998 RepID=A0A4U7B7A0_9PEZI|nr:hypothetical protein C1H76_2201 [Elsinoe australis]